MVLISFSKSNKNNLDQNLKYSALDAFYVSMLGLFVALIFTSKAIVSKIYHDNYNYISLNLFMDGISL